MSLRTAILRIARPTDNLQGLVRQYTAGLGLEILGSFEDHAGFDGVMLGLDSLPWHLEFTSKSKHMVGRAPTEDNLLVFYLEGKDEHKALCERMGGAGFCVVASFNPFWDTVGVTFEDVDGYRVVLVRGTWPNA